MNESRLKYLEFPLSMAAKWVPVSVATCFGLYFTKDRRCLLALLIPAVFSGISIPRVKCRHYSNNKCNEEPANNDILDLDNVNEEEDFLK